MIVAAWLTTLCFAAAAPQAQAQEARPFALMVGDPAPKLSLARWLKGEPTSGFAPGHVYVVEFWATWCVPCKRSIPHLTALQKRFEGKLSVIGVDVWEPDLHEVEPFVQKMGDDMGYAVAMDDVPPAPADCSNESAWSAEHGAMSISWLAASGWKDEGIPTAFIVDGEGRVAWIGDPQDLDGPVEHIVGGSWALADETRAYRSRMEHTLQARPIRVRLHDAAANHDAKAVVQCLDELLRIGGAEFGDLAGRKFQTMFVDLHQRDEACAFARVALDGVARDSSVGLGQIGHTIAFDASPPSSEELALALAVTQRADSIAKSENADILDTLARVEFLQGHPALAAETERRAIAKATEASDTRGFEERLRAYEGKAGG